MKLCVLIPELFKHMYLYLVMVAAANPFCSTLRYKPDLGTAGFGTKDYMPQWATLWMEKCTTFRRRRSAESWRGQSKVIEQIYGWEMDQAQICDTNPVKTHWILTVPLDMLEYQSWDNKEERMIKIPYLLCSYQCGSSALVNCTFGCFLVGTTPFKVFINPPTLQPLFLTIWMRFLSLLRRDLYVISPCVYMRVDVFHVVWIKSKNPECCKRRKIVYKSQLHYGLP